MRLADLVSRLQELAGRVRDDDRATLSEAMKRLKLYGPQQRLTTCDELERFARGE